MKRRWLLSLICISITFLFACGSHSNNNTKQVQNPDDHVEQLSKDEVQEIIHNNFQMLREEMNQIYNDYEAEWTELMSTWIEKPDKAVTSSDFKKPQEIVTEALSPYVSEPLIDDIVKEYLLAYFCQCNDYYIFQESDAEIRFEVLEQRENYFKAKSLHLYDYVHENPGTFTYEYEKTDDGWKFKHIGFVSAEEEPLDITFDEIKYYTDLSTGEKKEAVLLEEIEVDGREYLVIQREGWVDVIDKEDSSLHYEKSKIYNE